MKPKVTESFMSSLNSMIGGLMPPMIIPSLNLTMPTFADFNKSVVIDVPTIIDLIKKN